MAYFMVLKDKQNHCFLVCNLRPVFEKVRFDLRRSLEPFKDLVGCFDPSSTALTKRVQRYMCFVMLIYFKPHRSYVTLKCQGIY